MVDRFNSEHCADCHTFCTGPLYRRIGGNWVRYDDYEKEVGDLNIKVLQLEAKVRAAQKILRSAMLYTGTVVAALGALDG